MEAGNESGDGACLTHISARSERSARCTVWRGGSLVEIERLQEESTTGKVARLMGKQVGGGIRGKVKGFSVGSRRRLLKLFARLRNDALPLFVTLTLPDGVKHDGHTLKDKYLRRFKARLGRKFPHAAGVWRVDIKRRKSGSQMGEPYPHVHMVVWGVPMMPGLQAWVSEAWYEAVGSGDEKHLRAGTQVQVARNSGQVKAYASKLYAAKDAGDDGQIDEQGRVWGILAEAFLPFAEAVSRILSSGEAAKVLRVIRHYFLAKLRQRGRRKGKARSLLWAFVDSTDRWAELLDDGRLVYS